MKIFEFKWDDGSIDWVHAPGPWEAKMFYTSFIGNNLKGCKVTEVPKEKWNDTYIIDPDEPEPYWDEDDYNEDDYDSGYKIEMSFAEYAEKYPHGTDIIATTNF